MKARLHATIYGDVQGVFFRAGTRAEAQRIGGITGWVRNTEDGAVEIMAEGGRDALEQLLSWCSHGPEGAVVEKVEHEWLQYKGEFSVFGIAYG